MNKIVHVVGAGLAGSEAAWQLANKGFQVKLYEMRPQKMTEAHHSENFAELVCSNSLRASQLDNAAGLLKEELRRAGSLLMRIADETIVPAGGALAVDRDAFSEKVTTVIKEHTNIEVIFEEIISLDFDEPVIICSGPLTSEGLFDAIKEVTEEDTLYFYDAAAPIVMTESVDMSNAFWQSRYDKGDGDDYLNCPLTKEEYERFYDALIKAKWTETKDFEKEIFFESCMPIEVMASRGKDTLLFGPMKPVGLKNPHTGEVPYAVVQLRKDNQAGTLMNLVGFQTRMVWGAQEEVFKLIPALKNAEIIRYGVMHRNTFLNGPKLLNQFNQLKSNPSIYFAGQITGIEGYIESIASGYLSALYLSQVLMGEAPKALPQTTAMGALLQYLQLANPDSFQPMHINYGIMPELEKRIRNKKERNQAYAKRALDDLKTYLDAYAR